MAGSGSQSQTKIDYEEKFDTIKTILVSQPKPERSPYFDLEKKYGLTIDWRQFIHVEGVSEKEFRKNRIRPDEFSAIIFTSKYAIENFFRICDEMRVQMSAETKYFCVTNNVANYLQKFIVYRKRKVFVGTKKIHDLQNYFNKHKAKEKFLLPCSNIGTQNITNYLDEINLDYKSVVMYNTLSSDLSDLSEVTYDALIFFSPQGIESLFENFPDFKQKNTRLAIWGKKTLKKVEDHGLYPNIVVPSPELPSMSMALEAYLKKSNR